LTDYYTSSILSYYSGNLYQQHSYFKYLQYDSEKYFEIVDGNNENNSFKYLLVNLKNIDKPLYQGPPYWKYYEPIENYYVKINKNHIINSVYKNSQMVVFMSTDNV